MSLEFPPCQDFEIKMTKKRKDKLVESAASRSKRKPKNDYSWVESDMSEDEVSQCQLAELFGGYRTRNTAIIYILQYPHGEKVHILAIPNPIYGFVT